MKNVHVRPSPDPREKKACARTRQDRDRIYERIYYKDILSNSDKLFIRTSYPVILIGPDGTRESLGHGLGTRPKSRAVRRAALTKS